MPQTAPNPNINIVPSIMVTPWLFRLVALLPNLRQITVYSDIIAQPAVILSKGGTLSL